MFVKLKDNNKNKRIATYLLYNKEHNYLCFAK